MMNLSEVNRNGEKVTLTEYIACSQCDALHEVVSLSGGHRAHCSRCGSELYQDIRHSIDKVAAFSLSALLLFVLSHLFPFLTIEINGLSSQNIMLSATLELAGQGFWELAVLVFITSILSPMLVICGLLYVFVPLKFGKQPAGSLRVYRLVKKLLPWSLVGVFMLGVVVAIVKLMDIATVVEGPSVFFMAGLLVAMVAANASVDERLVWGKAHDFDLGVDQVNAMDHGMTSCPSCRMLIPADQQLSKCPRCGEKLTLRKTNSIARTWAFILTAALLYIPANVYPIMTVSQFGAGQPDTILSGVSHLIESGMWGLALLVFFASIIVPVLKLLVMAYLLLSIQFSSCWRPRDRTLLFHLTEIVGAWSMLDIFLIGILVSLVKLDVIATIEVEPGASYFAAVVILTLFAAHSFEPRLIWDNCKKNHEPK